ncbi:hypothetical protein ACFWOX_33995 [Streptomyces sp. NPDC058467]|uniref:hypothetical protein n=1 Tax=Streptomyces sp. NPDC058467 TaxID=3346513 RepID=UPI00365A6A4F
MDRIAHLALADAALTKAENLAGDAETAAKGDARHKAEPLAAVGALWASIARTHASIARVTPEADDTTPGA